MYEEGNKCPHRIYASEQRLVNDQRCRRHAESTCAAGTAVTTAHMTRSSRVCWLAVFRFKQSAISSEGISTFVPRSSLRRRLEQTNNLAIMTVVVVLRRSSNEWCLSGSVLSVGCIVFLIFAVIFCLTEH